MEGIYAFLFAKIWNFQGSAHFFGVGSFSNYFEHKDVDMQRQFNYIADCDKGDL